MAQWLKRRLNLGAATAFQDRFASLQMTYGGPDDWALFSITEPGHAAMELYVPPETVERSPGLFTGWEPTEAPSGPHCALLVGAGDPFERFAIKSG